MAADITLMDARHRLRARGDELRASDFDQIVLLCTVDMSLWCSACCYEKYGPFHLVWTEHHGAFLEHADEVAKVHVTRVTHGVPTVVQYDQ